ncbi:MAG: DUF1036 domain-containing protein [Alphaproteobacteria bacterium]|nr:DUF1036 domain-containing protein [Alphaproteobacteria bacterium]
MRRTSLLLFIGLMVGLIGGLAPQAAKADMRLCNETSYVLQVAAAARQGVVSKTEGWIELLPGVCRRALADMPDDAQAYVYAKSDDAHAGEGLVFDGSERFCVASENRSFSVEGRRDCRRRGLIEADFAIVAGNSGRRLVEFTEKSNYGRRRARTAGLQRLLSDLQYEIGAIDGFGGERTREAEAAYKLRYSVKGDPKGEALLGRLIKTAQIEAGERGLTLCNRTAHLIWAATAQLRNDRFNTRGWMRVPADECTQVINESLSDRFYFYYAEAVSDDGRLLREAGRAKIWSGERVLCTKPTRFAIDGEENCLARGYDTHGFKKIDTGAARRWTINLE